jgi:hypothetical protein
MEDMGSEYNILIGKPEGKGPLGRSRRICEGNIKKDLRETGCEVVWTG